MQQPAGTSHGVTNPVSKEALLNQKSQPEAQASKKAVSTAAVKPTTAAQVQTLSVDMTLRADRVH